MATFKRNFLFFVILALFSCLPIASWAIGSPGDVDGDGDVDRDDVSIIFSARGEPASGPDDPRDVDGDGIITVGDGRAAVLLCTLPRCESPASDVIPPLINILAPADGALLINTPVAVSGTASDETALAGVTVNGVPAVIGGGNFNADVPLAEGLNVLTAVATDTSGNSASTSIQVTLDSNDPPQIITTPLTSATEGQLYNYDVDATDLDGDVPTFSLDIAPAGMGIDPSSGLISWTPVAAQVGPNPVTVRAADGKGGSATQSYSVEVELLPNNPPQITTTPLTSATEGQLYNYDVDATDLDGDVPTFSLDIAPAGMGIDPSSGLISWTPVAAQLGPNPVTVRAADGKGGSTTQSYLVDVDAFLIPVPDVLGLSQAIAENDIVNAGLTVGNVSTQVSDTVPAGDVISQIPIGGTPVAPNSSVDLIVSSGPPAAAQLSLSSNVVPTQGAGGSVDVDCVILDSNDQPTGLPVDLTTDDPTAVITGDTNFAFPGVGEFGITCEAIGFGGVMDTDTVVVVDDSVDPAFSDLGASLLRLEALHGDVLVANEGDDVPGLQAAKGDLLAEIPGVDLAALAGAPPVPTGGDVPTNAELLAAGDVPDAAVDTPYVNTIQSIRQNLMDFDALLGSVDTSTITQADVDAMNALTTAADGLAATLEALGDPSNTAILSVNTELNDIVSNLLPNQSVNVAQFTVDVIDTVPGIVYMDWLFDPMDPESLFALQQDPRNPEGFYADPQQAFSMIGLMTSTSIANSLRSRYIKTVYKPIMKHIAKMLNFLRTQNLGPFGAAPATLTFVFGNGSAASTIFEGGWIQVWGTGFDPVAANNIIEVSTQNGTFQRAAVVVSLGGGVVDDIADSSNFPAGMGNHPFGLPDAAVVRVITPGGTSNGIQVNLFQ